MPMAPLRLADTLSRCSPPSESGRNALSCDGDSDSTTLPSLSPNIAPIIAPMASALACGLSPRAPESSGFAPLRAASASALASLRSEEHTSELQSLMRISFAGLCMKQQNNSEIQLHI